MSHSQPTQRARRENLNENEIRSLIDFLIQRAGVDRGVTFDAEALISAMTDLAEDITPQEVIKHCLNHDLIVCGDEEGILLIHAWIVGKSGEDTDSIAWISEDDPSCTTQLPGSGNQGFENEEIPEYLGKYKVIELLGSGGMGQVYLAIHPVTEGHVAVKTIHEHLIGERSLERFRREGGILIGVTHPCVVRVYEVDLDHDPPFIVMEYIDGKDLGEASLAMRENGIPGIVRIVRSICEGVQAFHRLGIVHCDLKPGNIKITARGDVCVVDLGLAIGTSDSSVERNRERLGNLGESSESFSDGTIRGTPSFMAPEQIDFHAKITPRADVYSLGKILHLLLTGLHVHEVKGSRMRIMRIVANEFSVPASVALNMTAAIKSKEYLDILLPIVSKCLQPEPDDRYKNAGAIVEELDGFLTFVRDQERLAQRKREAKQRKLTGGLVSAIVLCVVSVAMALLFLSQRNAEARAAREATARAQAEEAAKIEAEGREEAEKKSRLVEAQKNQFSGIHLKVLENMRKAKWADAHEKIEQLLALDPGSVSVHQDLAKVLSNLRDPKAVEAFLWLAEHDEEKQNQENILMAMIALRNYGNCDEADCHEQMRVLASRLKSKPYLEMGKVLVLDTKAIALAKQRKMKEVVLVRNKIKGMALKRVEDLYSSAAANYVLGLYVSRVFPDRAIRALSEACALNRDFTAAMIAHQKVRRQIARDLPPDSTAKSVHLVAALDVLISLRAMLPGDTEVAMAYADCLLECAFLPLLSDFKHSYLKKAGEVVSPYDGRDWSTDKAFMEQVYAPQALSIELTIAKAYARRYQVAKQRHLMDAGMFHDAGREAMNRLYRLVKKKRIRLSKADKAEILKINVWMTAKKED